MNALIIKYKDSGRRGIANIGSTCYINTALQCLAHNLTFLEFVIGTHSELASPHKGLMKELEDIYNIQWKKMNGVVPRRFVRVLQDAFGEMLHIHEQNDINEFIALFVDKLNTSIGVPPPNTVRYDIKKVDPIVRFCNESQNAWYMSHSTGYSQLADMLYGQVVSQITCDVCNDITHVFDTFACLMLSFDESRPKTDDESVGEMLTSYMRNESLHARDCDQCQRQCPGRRIHRFSKLPNILMISIKRFDSKMQKISKRVLVPEELDMTPACIQLGNESFANQYNYRLMSIACHAGNMGYGHYYALCRHPDGLWYEYDDETVKCIDDYKRTNPAHYYMLFYERLVNI